MVLDAASKSPRNAKNERKERFAVARIVPFSLSRLYFSDKIVLRLPCAGGVRVLAAELAILRIAYGVRNSSFGVPEGTVLAAKLAILRIACVVKNSSFGIPAGGNQSPIGDDYQTDDADAGGDHVEILCNYGEYRFSGSM